MRKNFVQPDGATDENIMRRMRFAF